MRTKRSSRWRRVLGLASIALVAACATEIDRGFVELQRGNYDDALSIWAPAAQNGDPAAQYLLGAAWEEGIGSISPNLDSAASWYALAAEQGHILATARLANIHYMKGNYEQAEALFNHAARWGSVEAADALRKWGRPVPPADLQAAQQLANIQREEQAAIAAATVGQALGCALGGNCGSARTPAFVPPSIAPQSSQPAGMFSPIPPASSVLAPQQYGSTTSQSRECSSDHGCGVGYVCAKPPLQSRGVCMAAVDSYGTRTYAAPSSGSYGVNADVGGQCSFNSDCPIGFSCDQSLKACVR